MPNANAKKVTKEESTISTIVVERAKQTKNDGVIAIDLNINSVKIYGCFYKYGISKAGKPYKLVQFPQSKGKDGKYYNIVWFKLSDDDINNIDTQIDVVMSTN